MTNFSRDISKFVAIVANFAFGSSFMTLILHLEGEEVFGSAKCSADFLPRVNNESPKANHVKFSCPHVAIPTCHPNSVNNLQIHGSPCVTQNMFSILSQGGIIDELPSSWIDSNVNLK
jgi:hypothetical protein